MVLNEINTVDEIIPYIVAVVIAASLIRFITDWFKNKDKKKRRSVWVNFLRSNEIINKCILTFEKMKDAEGGQGTLFSRLFGFFLGFITILFLFQRFTYVSRNLWLSMAYSSLINVVPYISLLVLVLYFSNLKSERKNEEDLIKGSLSIVNFINAITWFMFGSGLITIIFIFISYVNLSQISVSDRQSIFQNFGISIVFIIIVFFALNFIVRQQFLDYLKYRLNKKYIKNFPYIYITTKAGEINGKIQDVFHDDLIILDDNGIKIVAEWDEITTLKLREKNPASLDLSYF